LSNVGKTVYTEIDETTVTIYEKCKVTNFMIENGEGLYELTYPDGTIEKSYLCDFISRERYKELVENQMNYWTDLYRELINEVE